MQKCRSNALDNNDVVKFTSSRGDNSATNDSMDNSATNNNMVMKIAHAELYTTSNIVRNFEFSTCNNVRLFLWTIIMIYKFRGDNSTTNDSMVMKIAHALLHMYTSIMYKFQSSTCKTVREKLQTKL